MAEKPKISEGLEWALRSAENNKKTTAIVASGVAFTFVGLAFKLSRHPETAAGDAESAVTAAPEEVTD